MDNFYLSSLLRLLFLIIVLTPTITFGQQTGSKDFFLNLDNYRGQIQWEQSTDRSTWTSVPNGNVGKLKLKPTQTTLYRAKITDPGCSPIYSNIKAAFFDNNRVVAAKLIEGNVILPEGAATALINYSVMSEIESSSVNSDGSFQILAADSTDQDVLLLLNGKKEVTMLGHYIGAPGEYLINSESTAQALLVMYPFLESVSITEKLKLIENYKAEPEFKQLKTK